MTYNIMTTLTKTTEKGNTSTWTFGRLSNGWYGGKSSSTGQKYYFSTVLKMNTCISKFIKDYGYSVPMSPIQDPWYS